MTNQADDKPINILTELRMRMWARKNFVPIQERPDKGWHPVVLDEMRRRDDELEMQQLMGMVITSSGIVPLERSRHETRLDQAHTRVPGTKLENRQGVGVDPNEIFIPHYA